MKLSLEWISDYVDLKDIDLDWLINKLTITTAEIEGITRLENDVIIEIDNKSITNRPDLWCHYGMAREIAAITERTLKAIPCIDAVELEHSNETVLDIEVLDKVKCLRYSAIRLSNLRPSPSPELIAERLVNCGIQTINIIVDLANYVMLDVGQPLHTFDDKNVDGIRVASLTQDTKFQTLDKAERQVPKDTLMICSKSEPLAIAGIMGGQESAISEDTESVLLESATFEGVAIRKASSALGLRTDASVRYEKFLDPEITTLAIGRFLKLLKQYQPEVVIASRLYDNMLSEAKPVYIDIQHKYIETYLGNSIDKETVTDILGRLQFEVKTKEGIYTIKVPSFRATKDITGKADIIEEILRVYGYDRIKGTPNKSISVCTERNSMKETEYLIKDLLVKKFAFNEVHSYCWYDNEWLKKLDCQYEDTLKIINSDVKQFENLRSDIVPNLLQIIYNNRKNNEEIKIFEIGRAFVMSDGQFTQHKHMVAAIYSNKNEEYTYSYIKGVCSHILKAAKNLDANYIRLEDCQRDNCLAISYQGQRLGTLYSLPSSRVKLFSSKHAIHVLDINLEQLDAIQRKELKYKPISRYPETYLDFSILTANCVPYDEIEEMISRFEHELILKTNYIGTYLGENLADNMKSTTVRIVIGDVSRTLQLEEINAIKELFIKHLEAHGMQLRQ